ncbi:Uma2 family endonuclease [Dyadobacter sp. 3J3]|uniref:Uma2 family endonuclease n=1 Tax=Dyadobacter sp. 3J3 TaxID=2606600 RepID=UPI001358288E|nr:Uma2 family endonuclease [Dyadobacter sp. 3J3]
MIDKQEKLFQDWDSTQIINGQEIILSSPKISHQRIVRKTEKVFERFIEGRNPGELFRAPLDVIFEENVNRVQPDLIFISKDNDDIIKDWIRGVPDLLIEVVSIESFHLDTVEKKGLYEKFGVKEYWIVLPEQQSVEIYTLKNDHYELFLTASEDQFIESKILVGLHFQVSFLFG